MKKEKTTYHIRDLATERTERFDDYMVMVQWAQNQTSTLYRTDGGWRAIGQPGIHFKFWDAMAPIGGAIVHRFVIHRFLPCE